MLRSFTFNDFFLPSNILWALLREHFNVLESQATWHIMPASKSLLFSSNRNTIIVFSWSKCMGLKKYKTNFVSTFFRFFKNGSHFANNCTHPANMS